MTRVVAAVLVAVVAVGALFGGIALIVAPDGTALGLETGMLPAWWPGDYLVPGLVLVTVFGVGGVAAFVALLARPRTGLRVTSLLGLALVGWIVVQIAMLGLILPPMQLGFAAIGLALVILGALGLRATRRRPG